jgi:hypothetical protein
MKALVRSEPVRRQARRVAVLTGVLVGINVVARLITRFVLPDTADPFLAGAWSVFAMVVAIAVGGFLRTRERRVLVVTGDLFFVIVATTLLVTLLGPFVSGDPVFDAGLLVRQFGLCAGLLVVGAAAGVLGAVALGLDPTSRAWQEQARRVRRQPGARR